VDFGNKLRFSAPRASLTRRAADLIRPGLRSAIYEREDAADDHAAADDAADAGSFLVRRECGHAQRGQAEEPRGNLAKMGLTHPEASFAVFLSPPMLGFILELGEDGRRRAWMGVFKGSERLG
jgi:hypothetical protein